MKILGRTPAMWLAVIAALVQMAGAVWGDFSELQQAGVNAVATLAFGLAVAAVVSRDQIVPIAASLVAAVGNLAISFGAHLSPEEMAGAGAVVVSVLTFFIHTQVTAPVGPTGEKVPRMTLADTPPLRQQS
jgi:hypothetical protein